MSKLPEPIRDDIAHAVRLEWWTIFWQVTIVIVMALVMGSSQAMKSAWVEDTLGLVPAAVFLLALHFERKSPTRRFPFGFMRANSLAFLIAATALFFMGGYLIYDAGMKLIAQEHPTIGPIEFFGEEIWMGWLMIAALIYSVIPPIIIGRLKQPVARRLHDKVLFTDSLMQKADWMTGLAATLGILGVGFGFWWADSVAALVISVDIVHDGFRASKIATAELIDGAPRKIDSDEIADEAEALKKKLEDKFPEATVRLRETGRYIAAEVTGVKPPDNPPTREELWPGKKQEAWRFALLSFAE
ncbi:putative cation efflux system protein [Methyloligella halotolerans]|uniref:Putative cation efflux system protein n=1 Tax=Methyloligella halotolerans TaxID=1177755 RepID=A0A1E2RVQ4_9HYPH|nr:cation diffusion facilitator family transporter [Methyloligella halotolerans]ODA66129.1 putative cation efflux system protein [Methyloligella halotolerans]